MTALLAGQPFRMNPESVRFGFRTKTSTIETIGGRVVQVFGTTFEDLAVNGSFGRGSFEEQRAFLARMRALAQHQEQLTAGQEIRFQWPEKGWDLSVALINYSNPDSATSIHVSRMVYPKWTLVFHIVNDNGTIATPANGADLFIKRLATGVGWKQTIYNGPNPDWLSGAAAGAAGNPAPAAPTAPTSTSTNRADSPLVAPLL
jgi:hypothetical protein